MSKRKLSSKFKITSRTIPAVMKRIEEFVRTAGFDHDRKFASGGGERRISVEHTVPIAILHFLDRPFDDQLALYDHYRPIYEKMVREFEASEAPGIPDAPIEPQSVKRTEGPKKK